MSETATQYQAGDEITIDGVTIVLCRRKGNTGVRWTWAIPATGEAGEAYQPTPEAAIDHARRAIGGPRCTRCGAPATMTAATVPTCGDCYDRYADR